MRWALPALALAVPGVSAVLAGCGGVQAADLFVVTRTGAGGTLTLLVNEEGGVRCDGRPRAKLSDSQLVQARAIQEELHDPASKGLRLAARSGSIFSFAVREEAGTVRFADNSAGKPHALDELVLLVTEVAQQSCHLAQ